MQIFLARQRAKCDHLIWMITNLSLRSEKKQLMSRAKSTDLRSKSLKEWQPALLSCFKVVFDDLRNDLSFAMTEIHGFGVGQSSAHVPNKLQCFSAYFFGLLVHAIDYCDDLLFVRDQESDTKKRALSKVNACSYSCWQDWQRILSGRISLTSLIWITRSLICVNTARSHFCMNSRI